ncbi:MAG: aconitase family protein, partial [Rhodothermia bacterium]
MSNSTSDLLGARSTIDTPNGPAYYYRLHKLIEDGFSGIEHFPFSIKVLLESLVRNCDGQTITEDDVKRLASYDPSNPAAEEIPFKPARVLLQDFTGVPAVVDLAALRSAMYRLGGNPDEINPRVPVNLVIDHSVQVDTFGSEAAFLINTEFEFKRNRERYEF